MRKFLFALAVVLVTLAVAAPDLAFAATAKYSGTWRFRGVTSDDGDRNERKHDSLQDADWNIRPRWSVASKGNKVKVFMELDLAASTFAADTKRINAEYNRWAIDAAIPGTTLRYQVGRTDFAGPGNTGKRLIGGFGTYRFQGHKIYGKLTSNLSLSFFNAQFSEGKTAASDDNDFYLSLAWKSAPNLTITPFLLWTKHNGQLKGKGVQFGPAPTATVALGEEDRDIISVGANVRAKFGILSLDILGLIQDGELTFSKGAQDAGRANIDIDAYAILIQAWLNFGKLKVGFYGSFFPGDDDDTSTPGLLGTQTDNSLSRYIPGGNAGGKADRGGCRIDGPQLFTGVRYHTKASGFTANACGSGDGGSQGNGAQIWEILAKYKLTKALSLAGNISVIRSAAKRANIVGGSTFVNAKDIGTEIDVSARYNIYKHLWTRMTFAYLFAGDYGKVSGTTVRDFDDTWALFYELRSTF